MKKIKRLDIVELGQHVTSEGTNVYKADLYQTVFPESRADRLLAHKLNEIIDHLNEKEK